MPGSASRYRDITEVARLIHHAADRKMLWLGLCTAIVVMVNGALAALAPLVLKSLVDAVGAAAAVEVGDPWVPVMRHGATYLLLVLAVRAMTDIRPLLSGTINQTLHHYLTHRFFEHVICMPMATLLKRRSGELLHSLDLGSAGAQMVVTHLVSSLLPVLVEFSTMAVVLVHLGEPALVVVFGVTTFAYLAIFATGARLTKKAAHEVSRSSMEPYALLVDGLAHVETLRCLAAEEQVSSRLRKASATVLKHWQRLNRLNASVAMAASVTFALSMAACLSIGAHAVTSGAMSVGGFVLIAVYMLEIVRPLESAGTAAQDLSRAFGYLRPMLDLLSEPVAAALMGDASSPIARRKTGPTVRFENVHFEYAPDRPVLSGIDLEFAAGSTTAIVGRSGSGKSSLARLLMRLYMPQRGRILLDGEAIESMDFARLRTLIGFVPQEIALLHATISENITLGTPAATPEDIRASVRDAQLDAFIDTLPLGLDTRVGERGMQLSGGERQRVGIARALLRRPSLLVLDEPTSMLDSRTEREIQNSLNALSGNTTTIVIAHRLSTIVSANQIVVLDNGRIFERGNHRELLTKNGLYAQMWRQQMVQST
jgi:ABC-type multidrug transport system fused ATPase/permease subunit